ncbi:MAG: efflux RND transporter permease subunit [Acidobacteriota bacterium]|nr:efflux RND transporter permease subunit [Acidobacteriota bacterium]
MPRKGWVIALAFAWGVAGLLTFLNLRRDLFPDLSLPTVQLLIQSPGRAATELELTVAQPVEQALTGLPGVKRVNSILQAGIVQVVITFESDADPWHSRQLIAEKLSTVQGGFPEGTTPPLMTSASSRLQEIQEIILEGPGVDPMKLRDHAIKTILPRLQSVPGVARVELLGGEARQLQITLLPERMRLMGVTLAQVLEALDGSQQNAAAGVLEIQDKSWFVVLGTDAAKVEQVRHLPVHTAHGLVALGDLAEIREAPGFRLGLARYQGFEAVSMRIIKQPTAETIATAKGVRAALGDLKQSLPPGMSLNMFYDQADFVEHALGGVTRALLIGGLFVALVLVLLLGSLRGAMVVIVLLPLATFGAAIPLRLMGEGLNAMTLGGLAIAVGLLVDAGVIMVENLAHRLHQAHDANESRTVTLTKAAAEVAVPILTAVLVILAVFIPLLAIGGVAGKLYAPLAVAVASAMTLSLVLSFTLVPVLVDRFLPPGVSLEEPRFVQRIKGIYRPALDWALQHGVKVRIIALGLTIPSLWLAFRLGSNFLPTLDEGALLLQSILPAETSLQAVDDGNRMLEKALSKVPGVQAHYRRTGRGEITEDPMPPTRSDILVILTPGTDPMQAMGDINEAMEKLPFATELSTPMMEKISEGLGGAPADIQIKLFNPDLDLLAKARPDIQKRLSLVEGVASVNPDTGGPLPKWQVIPDDDALRRLDVPRSLLFQTVQTALQGISLQPRFDGPQRIERIVRFPNDGRVTAESLKRLPLVVEQGKIIELGQVATLEEQSTPSMIRREAGQRRLGFNIRTTGDLGGTAKRLEQALAQMSLPKGTTISFGGKIEEARETQRRLSIAIVIALVLVVGLLYLALSRWRDVLVVLATLPDAFVGGLLALWIAGETWNVSSIVGMIGLFGVAVQNSLVLITQAKGLLAQGLPFEEALREASLGRVRPKLMTAGAAILGLSPMLFGIGGSELERPLAIVMVGGLITSTLFTLLALPSFYAWVGRPKPTEAQ